MALIYIDSCGDHYTGFNVEKKWSIGRREYYINSTIVSTGGRTGNCILGQGSYHISKNLKTPIDTIIVGFALKLTTFPSWENRDRVISFSTGMGENIPSLFYDRYGKIMYGYFISNFNAPTILFQSNPDIMRLNNWQYVEVMLKLSLSSSGIVKVVVDGNLIIDRTNVVTYGNSSHQRNKITQVVLGVEGTMFDDVYIADTTGTKNNTFLGDQKVSVLRVTGPGRITSWSVSGASSSGAVLSAGGGHIYSSVLSQKSVFALENIDPSTTVISGIQTVILARKNLPGIRKISHAVGDGSTEITNPNYESIWSDHYKYSTRIYDKNPITDSDWTKAAVDSIEVGPIIVE